MLDLKKAILPAKFLATAGNVDLATALVIRQGDYKGQLPTVFPIFEIPSNNSTGPNAISTARRVTYNIFLF